jgi:hypothetical protein
MSVFGLYEPWAIVNNFVRTAAKGSCNDVSGRARWGHEPGGYQP